MFSGESCAVGKRPKQQDDCWSYVICFCATLSQALIMGIALGTFGVLLPVIMQQFNSGRGQTGEEKCQSYFFNAVAKCPAAGKGLEKLNAWR